jgi:hypothetical protein
MLNEVANTISKAPKTIVSARALLALAHLYAKVDMNRGVEELGNAVRTINALESPDFSRQFVMMKIEGKTFGSFASYSTPGFNPRTRFVKWASSTSTAAWPRPQTSATNPCAR